MKVYLSKINESWIVDRMRNEWYEYNPDLSTEKIKESDRNSHIDFILFNFFKICRHVAEKILVPITTAICDKLIFRNIYNV